MNKKATAELAALTAIALVVLAIGFAAVRDSQITGLVTSNISNTTINQSQNISDTNTTAESPEINNTNTTLNQSQNISDTNTTAESTEINNTNTTLNQSQNISETNITTNTTSNETETTEDSEQNTIQEQDSTEDTDFETASLCGGSVPCGCGDTVNVDWSMTGNLNCSGNGLILGSDDVTIDCDGNTLDGTGNGYGIDINNFDNITIKNCNITGFDKGISAEYSSEIKIESSTVSKNVNTGIYMFKSSGNYINNCNVSDQTDINADGISLSFVNHTTLTNNNIFNNPISGYGLYLRGYNVTLDSNNIYSNFYNMRLTNSEKITIRNNNITKAVIYNLKISSVNKTLIDNNNLSDTTSGNTFAISNSKYTNITGNTMNNAAAFGIESKSNTNLKVSNNEIKNSAAPGVYIISTNNSEISLNYITQSSYAGMFIRDSYTNNITSNNITFSGANGLYIYESIDQTINFNNISNNAGNGTIIYKSFGIKLNENKINNNSEAGISSSYSSRQFQPNIFHNNTINNNTYGIFISYSNHTFISYNNLSYNSLNGILVRFDSIYTDIFHNKISFNQERGVYIATGSEYAELQYNDIFNNSYYGAEISSEHAEAANNDFFNNDKGGVLIVSPHFFLSQNNIFNNNGSGIKVSGQATDGLITSNDIFQNNESGIEIYLSNQDIDDNDIYENNGNGIKISNSDNISLADNKIYLNNGTGIDINDSFNISIDDGEIYNNTLYGIKAYSVDNLTIDDVDILNNNQTGIYLNDSNDTTISNNEITNNGRMGINLVNSHYNSFIKNNIKENKYRGIWVKYSDENNITNNNLSKHSYAGISMYHSSNSTLEDNYVNDSSSGLEIQHSQKSILINNIIEKNNIGISNFKSNHSILNNNIAKNNDIYGIYLRQASNCVLNNNTVAFNNKTGFILHSFSNSNITNSTILNNNETGITIYKSSNGNLFESNIINLNSKGIYINSSLNNEITANFVNLNNDGIYLGNASNNIIYNNYFNNTNNLFEDNYSFGNMWNTTKNCTSGNNIFGKSCIGGNYWSDYYGVDYTGDWIGDTNLPYKNRDYLPLVSNSIPIMSFIHLNSTYGANTTDEDLTCYANASDGDDDYLTYHGFWYKDGVEQLEYKWNATEIDSDGNTQGFGVATDKDNNVFVSGYDYYNTKKRAVIYKYNSTGSQLEDYFYPDSVVTETNINISFFGNREYNDIAVDKNGNIFAVGYSTLFSWAAFTPPNPYPTSLGNHSNIPNLIITKLDNDLNKISEYPPLPNSTDLSIATSVAIDSQNNIIVAGYTNKSGNYNYLVMKFDPNLKLLWNKTFNFSSKSDYAMDVAVDKSDDIIVTGRTKTTSNHWNFLTLKYNSTGSRIWTNIFTNSVEDRAYGVDVDSQDNIYVVGRTKSINPDIIVVKYNPSGSKLLDTTYGGSADDTAQSISIDSRDNIVIGAWTNSIGAGQRDMWILKLNTSLDEQLNFTIGGTENEYAYGITTDNYDDIILTGSTKSFPTTDTYWRMYTIKYGGFETGTYPAGQIVNVSTINSSETTVGETWSCEVMSHDSQGYSLYNMSNDLLIIPDLPPSWSNIQVYPSSPTTYSPTQNYQFNVTWKNQISVDTVQIEHNFTGTLTNYTVTTHDKDVYYYNYPPLAAGSYVWREYANDTNSHKNQTPQQTYIVNKAPTSVNLSLNGIEDNITITYPQTLNAIYSTNALTANMYRDGNNVNLENNTPITLAAGYYNYTVINIGNQNYNASSKTYFANITKANSSCSLTFDPPSGQDYPVSVNASCSCTNPEANPTLWRNISGTMTNVTSTENNKLIDLAAGNNSYVCNVSETQNYTKASNSSVYIINKYPTSCSLTFDQPNGIVYGNPINASCSCDYGTPALYRNNTDVTATENNQPTMLAAGNHNYICNVSGDNNHSSSSNATIFTVNKAPTSVNLSLNGIEDNITITYPQTLNAIYSTNASTAAMYRNGTDISSENNTQITLAAGYYNYTVINPGNQNYSSSSKTFFATILKNTTICSLTFNPSSPQTYPASVNASCLCTNPEANPTLWRNISGTMTNVTSTENNQLIDLAAGSYGYICNVSATQNYTKASNSSVYIINKYPTSCSLTFDQPNGIVYGNPINASCSCDYGTPALYRNNTDVTAAENNKLINLPAGLHNYTCNLSNQNYTGKNSTLFNINKANSSVNLLLDGNDKDITKTPKSIVNVSAYRLSGEGNITLYINGNLIGSAVSYIDNVSQYNITGSYNATVRYPQTQNYTASSETHWLTVKKKKTGGGSSGGGGTTDNACEDGIDNDGDGLIDYPDDPGCTGRYDNDEVDCYTDIDCTGNKICKAQQCIPCSEEWVCTSWSPRKCPQNEIQIRTCEDLNDCGTEKLKPKEQKSCEYEEPEEKEEPERPSVEKPQPPIISDKAKRIIGYSLSSVVGIALLILLIFLLIKKTSIYALVGKQIDKGLPESQILQNISQRGHSGVKSEQILKEAKIKKLIKVISENRAKGFELKDIVSELASKGWDKKIVEQVINRLK